MSDGGKISKEFHERVKLNCGAYIVSKSSPVVELTSTAPARHVGAKMQINVTTGKKEGYVRVQIETVPLSIRAARQSNKFGRNQNGKASRRPLARQKMPHLKRPTNKNGIETYLNHIQQTPRSEKCMRNCAGPLFVGHYCPLTRPALRRLPEIATLCLTKRNSNFLLVFMQKSAFKIGLAFPKHGAPIESMEHTKVVLN